MHPSYYHRAHAAIMVFDITRKTTYKSLQKWWAELQTACKGVPVLVVANKIDEDMTVTGKSFAFAEKNKLPLLFVSASDGTNVVRVSLCIGAEWLAANISNFCNVRQHRLHKGVRLAAGLRVRDNSWAEVESCSKRRLRA